MAKKEDQEEESGFFLEMDIFHGVFVFRRAGSVPS